MQNPNHNWFCTLNIWNQVSIFFAAQFTTNLVPDIVKKTICITDKYNLRKFILWSQIQNINLRTLINRSEMVLPIYSAGLFCLTLIKFSKLSFIVLMKVSFFPKHTWIMLSTLPLKSGKNMKNFTKYILRKYNKNPKTSDTWNICCNYPQTGTVSFYYSVMGLKDAARMANSVDRD